MIDDPVLNCIIYCCDALRAQNSLETVIEEYCGKHPRPQDCAEIIFKYFDLAEKGTLQPFKDSIRRLDAAGSPHDGGDS